MLSDQAGMFLMDNHHGVLATHRLNGGLQMSVVTCGRYKEGVAFTTTKDRAKLKNLQRDRRCGLLVSRDSWRGYLGIDGRARLLSPENTDAEMLRRALREVYRAAAGKEHPDWTEYDYAMVQELRVVVLLVPEKVYGPMA